MAETKYDMCNIFNQVRDSFLVTGTLVTFYFHFLFTTLSRPSGLREGIWLFRHVKFLLHPFIPLKIKLTALLQAVKINSLAPGKFEWNVR